MFSIRGIFIFLFAAAATLVFARDPSADELDAVEQAFIDAGLIPSVFPETALEAFFLLGFVDANGTETQAVKTPGDIVNTTTAAIPPVMATQGIHHLKGSRLVAFALDIDDPQPEFRIMFAQNLSVREDVPLPHLRMGAHLLNNQVTQTPPANAYIAPAPVSGSHRVVFAAYKQPAVFDFSSLDVADRGNFDVATFANETGLGLPVAITFIEVPAAT